MLSFQFPVECPASDVLLNPHTYGCIVVNSSLSSYSLPFACVAAAAALWVVSVFNVRESGNDTLRHTTGVRRHKDCNMVNLQIKKKKKSSKYFNVFELYVV